MEKIKDFLNKHQDKVILTIGAILIAGCSFAAGRISTPEQQEEKPIEIKQETAELETETEKEKPNQQEEKKEEKTQTEIEAKYVGSVEGGTYFLADSKLGQAISSDKKIWFETQEEADEQGFRPAKDIPETTKSTSKKSTTKDKDDDENDENKEVTTKKEAESNEDCSYVASSRGKKYYKAESSSAKALSESNKVCFSSEKEAENAGYEPSASIK